MDIMDAIAWRSSCRSFAANQISDSELKTIIQAANAAPISMGKREDIELIVVQDRDFIDKMEASAAEFARNNMGVEMEHAAYGAPTVVIVAGRKHEGMLHTQAYLNTGCVMENMLLAATSLGLGSVYLFAMAAALSQDEHLCRELTISEDFFPVSIMAVGTPTDVPQKRELTEENFNITYLNR